MKKSKALLTLLLASLCAASFTFAGCELLDSLTGGSSSVSTSKEESSSTESTLPESSVPESSVPESSVPESSVPELVYESISDTQHKYGDAVEDHTLTESDVVEASCEKAGSKTVSCSKCDFSKTVAIPALEHDWSKVKVLLEWDDFDGEFTPAVSGACANGCNAIDSAVLSGVSIEDTATCTAAGDVVYSATLTLDGEVIARGEVKESSPQKDHLASEYSSDALHHWYEKLDHCDCEDVVVDKQAHTAETVFDYKEGTTAYSCTVCKYETVLPYILNDSVIELGENTYYLNTVPATQTIQGYYNEDDLINLFLEEDPSTPGNYFAPVSIPDGEDADFLDVVWESIPESELVLGVHYHSVRERTITTDYLINATFTADATGEYTFSVPSGTFVNIRLTASAAEYNHTYYTIGCDTFYNSDISATIMLAQGDTVSFIASTVGAQTDSDPDDGVDTTVSYGGKKVYEFAMNVSYEEANIPGIAADSPIETAWSEKHEFTLGAGESIFYAFTTRENAYQYFSLVVSSADLEIYVEGEKVDLSKVANFEFYDAMWNTHTLTGYESPTFRCEKNAYINVEIKNPTNKSVFARLNGNDTSPYPLQLKEGTHTYTVNAADLAAGISVSYHYPADAKFIVTFDEASFTEHKIAYVREDMDRTTWLPTYTPTYGYVNDAFIQYTHDYVDENGYASFMNSLNLQAQAPIDAETVTFTITVTVA